MVRLAIVTFTVLALLLPGCLSPQDAPAPAAPPAREPGTVSDGPAPTNLWLLDAPHPKSAQVSGGEEPIILVTPAGTILVGDTGGVHRSTNGGSTWTHPSVPSTPGGFVDGYTIARDDVGRLYTATTQGQLIGVAVSTNEGQTWTMPATARAAAFATIADRPWLSANGDGHVVLVQYGDASEECIYSSDAGQTWTKRTLPFLQSGSPNAGNVILDDQEQVWYAYDGGITRWLSPCNGAPQKLTLPASGAQIFTQLAVTPSGDSFVAQPSSNNGKMELRGFQNFAASTYKAVTVSNASLKSNTFGAIAARDDNEIAVAWYGSETAGNPSAAFSGQWNVFVARVQNFWSATPTITVDRISAEPNHVGGFCMSGIACTTGDRDLLDYFGVAYDAAGNLHVAYGHDGSTANAVVRHAKLDAL